MRVLVSILLLAVAIFAQDPQASAPSAAAPNNLSIPVQLSKTIDTKKCKTGDTVEMKTLEPVLVANGLVMPENAKLHGRVVGAASRQNDQPSWVLLVVDRADWKQHTVALHAFVVSQITVKATVPSQNNNAFDDALNMPDRFNRRHAPQPQTNPTGQASRSAAAAPRDATLDGNGAQQLSYHGLDDLRIMRDKNGAVYLVSQKPHLKLPSGAMFMLRNQAILHQEEAVAGKLANRAH